MEKLAVVIVAGGSGTRMGTELPKQFLEVSGRPILVRTLEAFTGVGQCIVVLPQAHVALWKEIVCKYNVSVGHAVVEGGASRFHSVLNGLRAVDEGMEYVAVHDGVRPFVSPEVIADTLSKAKEYSAAVPVIPVTDTIRMMQKDGSSKTLDRNTLFAVQTPQIFEKKLLEKAYQQPFDPKFTDDASVVENLGHKIALSQGDPQNIKITYPKDL